MIEHVTDSNFADVVEKSSELVLVDFWASWCGPCKMLGPIFEEVSGEVAGVTFAKLNVDENPSTAARYRVGSIPTVLAIKNGRVVDTMVGFKPKAEIKKFVERNR
ncbi:thioredoxin [Proteiniclasticum sp. QWL-01]|uniref:thioredoxin n=1 Tax=Proteiniclasticum sp. QWL-01 TaxID=3036945 RepID=UPI00220516BF|nr:thioredoxin [Proteiniclasticum sp. QWL-01]UUM11854.1 thioredoxin [Clostridiaceae bacterium HFYG-1003]WFF73345.1 thioredoxin [Proteiniclasticum sp. QWL-01]